MLKKFLCIFFVFILWGQAFADIATVGYVHDTISDLKAITVTPSNTITRITSARYLMEQIDKANKELNGMDVTDYATSDLAQINILSAEKAREYIQELIRLFPAFYIQVNGVNSFDFQISARGEFYVIWGDGNIDTITKTDTTTTTVSHTYSTTGNYEIRIRGTATGYDNADTAPAVISFNSSANKTKIVSISGSLSKIFPTIGNVNPRFTETFSGCTGITGLPDPLFADLTGPYSVNMFKNTFTGCTGLTGPIPDGLFGTMSGAPKHHFFYQTFKGCVNLAGPIPSGLFGTPSGQPSWNMFQETFSGCTSLTGNIPSGLFGALSGTPSSYMFAKTFEGCAGLTGPIPAGLFGTLTGNALGGIFYNTFAGCSGLTGPIPAGLFGNINGKTAANMFQGTFNGCSNLTGPIPSGLFGSMSGAPSSSMFADTFMGCTKLSGPIPAGLFGTISGTPVNGMYSRTFQDCSNLTGTIPAGLLGTFTGDTPSNMFNATFKNCTKITGIADGIWDLTGLTDVNATWTFGETFYGMTGVTTPTPTIAAGSGIKMWQKFTKITWQSTFRGAVNMADYASIISTWK